MSTRLCGVLGSCHYDGLHGHAMVLPTQSRPGSHQRIRLRFESIVYNAAHHGTAGRRTRPRGNSRTLRRSLRPGSPRQKPIFAMPTSRRQMSPSRVPANSPPELGRSAIVGVTHTKANRYFGRRSLAFEVVEGPPADQGCPTAPSRRLVHQFQVPPQPHRLCRTSGRP